MSFGRIVAAAVLGVSAISTVAGCSGSIEAPTAYANYNADDKSFQVEYPEGWDVVGGGNVSFHSAKFSRGPAVLRVKSDFTGSVLGDIANLGGGVLDNAGPVDPELAFELAPVNPVHNFAKESMPEEIKNFKEVETTAVQSGFGEGRRTEFTGSSLFGGKIHGYWTTYLSGDRRIQVICQAPEKHWKTIQPAFDKAITGVRHGQ